MFSGQWQRIRVSVLGRVAFCPLELQNSKTFEKAQPMALSSGQSLKTGPTDLGHPTESNSNVRIDPDMTFFVRANQAAQRC